MTTNAANLQEASLEHPTKASGVDGTSFVRRRLHDNDILLRPRSSVTIFTRHCRVGELLPVLLSKPGRTTRGRDQSKALQNSVQVHGRNAQCCSAFAPVVNKKASARRRPLWLWKTCCFLVAEAAQLKRLRKHESKKDELMWRSVDKACLILEMPARVCMEGIMVVSNEYYSSIV